MKRLSWYLSVLLFATGAFAEDACKPVTGHFLASVVPPGVEFCPSDPPAFCTSGRVWGGIQGQYQFVMSGTAPAVTIGGEPSVSFFAGQSTIFLHHGSTAYGIDTGSIDFAQGGFASLITFHATPGVAGPTRGQIRLRGEFSATAGTTAGDYTGTFCSN
jgi:hypothetical protein